MCWSKVAWCVQMMILLFVLYSCINEPEEKRADSYQCMMEIRLSVSGDELCSSTRSILPEGTIDTRLTDVTLASYDSQGRLVNAIYYDDIDAPIVMPISKNMPIDIYAVANMGDMSKRFPVDESEVSGMTYVLGSYVEVVLDGIPMCGVSRDCIYKGNETVNVDLERLFAKVNVRILHTELEGSEPGGSVAKTLANKSIYLRQANRRMMPFAATGSRAETTGDLLSISDFNSNLADLDKFTGQLDEDELEVGLAYIQDTTIVLYVPENAQGCLLPENNDPFYKVAGSISGIDGKPYDKLCTYVEFNAAKPNKGDGYYGDLTYRCYLGENNVSDFSVRRNSTYELTMTFTDAGFVLDNWKVVRGGNWVDTRTLYFVDEPYYVYPGETVNVLVHYNKYSPDADLESLGPSSDLVFEFNEAAMRYAGLACTFMKENKVVGKNRRQEFYCKVVASNKARAGSSFPIKVSLKDGTKSDVTTIHIADIGNLLPMWSFTPEYVSQVGNLSFLGTVTSLLPLSAKVSDSSVINCVQTGDKSFRVIGLKEGAAQITVTNSDGSQSCIIPISIAAPQLKVDKNHIVLSPDGEKTRINYQYVDNDGKQIENVDESTYLKYLKPKISGCGYASMDADMSTMDIYMDCLNLSGKQVTLGSYYGISVSAVNCPGAGNHSLRTYIDNPFSGISIQSVKSLNDYTLLGLSSVNSVVRNYFSTKLSVADMIYDIQPATADANYISASLVPVWGDGFSNSCGVYDVEYLHSDPNSSKGASVCILQNDVTANTSHSAGRHDLMLHVQNRYSLEKVSKSIAEVDVYVHTAIGANATFDYKICRNPSGGVNGAPTIAGIYNSIAGKNIYDTSSSDRIYHMDVSVEFLTPIDKVYLFNKMRSALSLWTNTYDCMDWVTPSVQDGDIDEAHGHLYSVCSISDQRTLICGESVGDRRGVGVMLYRALAKATYTSSLSQIKLLQMFLGYSSSTDSGSEAYAPEYDIHNMNVSADMSKNIVGKNAPYYFSPKSCADYRDASGRGYHVVHNLNTIAPDSCGWINLL